jgi:hypothetical protein
MANVHGTATEPVDGDEDNAPDASGKGISRKRSCAMNGSYDVVAGHHHFRSIWKKI